MCARVYVYTCVVCVYMCVCMYTCVCVQHGAAAIHYAVTHCSLPVMDVLEKLVDAGADVNLRDDVCYVFFFRHSSLYCVTTLFSA